MMKNEPRSRHHRVRVLAALFACLAWFTSECISIAAPADKPEYRFALSEDESPQCVAFSPDGRKVFAGTNAGRIWSWELKKGAVPEKIRLTSGGLLSGSVDCLAISPDGGTALAGCADRRVRVVDLATSKLTHVLEGHRYPVFSVAFSRDGQLAFSGSSGGARSTVIHWDLKSGKPVRQYEAKDMIDSLAIAPDGRTFLTTEFLSVQEWELQSGKRLRSLEGHEYRVHGVFYSADGQTIISGGWDGVRVWEAKTGRCIRTVGDGKFNAEYVALSPDSRRILLGGQKEMQLLDLKTGQELKHWEGLAGKVHVAFSPSGRYALSGEEDGPVSLWALPEVGTTSDSPSRKE
jgi:sugar lactone lactonase YvrE